MNEERPPGSSAFDRVVAAWRASVDHHEWGPPASPEAIELAEVHLGRSLPAELRRLYELADGVRLVDGNLNLYPLRSVDRDFGGLLTKSSRPLGEEFREWGWPIPPELLVVGDNGGDEMFGMWLPTRPKRTPAPVIIIAEGGDAAMELPDVEGLAIAGTSLETFLVARTAYYLLARDAESALDALGVPAELREREPDDELFAEIHAWADPDLEDPDPDPYQRPVGTRGLGERFGADEP